MVLEFIDVFLEVIVRSSIIVFPWILIQLGNVSTSSFFDVKGAEVFLVVVHELGNSLFLSFDTGVCHPVIPGF